MEMTEVQIDHWLERGTKFFRNLSRNPMVRGALRSRGLTDAELAQGWKYTARLGARPDEVIEPQEMDPRRRSVAEAYVNWLNEWREVARVAIGRRDERIALGIAQRRQAGEDVSALTEDAAAAATQN